VLNAKPFFYGAKAHREIRIFKRILATTTKSVAGEHSTAQVFRE